MAGGGVARMSETECVGVTACLAGESGSWIALVPRQGPGNEGHSLMYGSEGQLSEPNRVSSVPRSQTFSLVLKAVAWGSSQGGGRLLVGLRVSTCPSAKQTLATPAWR